MAASTRNGSSSNTSCGDGNRNSTSKNKTTRMVRLVETTTTTATKSTKKMRNEWSWWKRISLSCALLALMGLWNNETFVPTPGSMQWTREILSLQNWQERQRNESSSLAFWHTHECQSLVGDADLLKNLSRPIVRRWLQEEEEREDQEKKKQNAQRQGLPQRLQRKGKQLQHLLQRRRQKKKQKLLQKQQKQQQQQQQQQGQRKQKKRRFSLGQKQKQEPKQPKQQRQPTRPSPSVQLRRLLSEQETNSDNFIGESTDSTSLELAESEALWSTMMTACHGPHIPPEEAKELTAMQFLRQLVICASKDASGGQFCKWPWVQYLQNDMDLSQEKGRRRQDWKPFKLQEAFVTSAKCALHLEYPLFPSHHPDGATTTTATTSWWNYPSWSLFGPLLGQSTPTTAATVGNPKRRVILVTIVAGRIHLRKACPLLRSALRRGWHVIVGRAEEYSGHVQKYQLTLRLLDLVVPDSPDALVVFVDATDNLVMQTPKYVLRKYQAQPHDFVWSTNILCYPVGYWPHNVGMKRVVCGQGFFPRGYPVGKPGNGAIPFADKTHSINSGGWIATVSSAHAVLEELLQQVKWAESDEQIQKCFDFGTDQLLANVQYLQHATKKTIGLDAQSQFFRTNLELLPNEWRLVKHEKVCFRRAQLSCPAFFHFSGHYLDKDLPWTNKFHQWSRLEHLCELRGRLTVVDLDSEQVYDNVESTWTPNGRASNCTSPDFCWPCGSAEPWSSKCRHD